MLLGAGVVGGMWLLEKVAGREGLALLLSPEPTGYASHKRKTSHSEQPLCLKHLHATEGSSPLHSPSASWSSDSPPTIASPNICHPAQSPSHRPLPQTGTPIANVPIPRSSWLNYCSLRNDVEEEEEWSACQGPSQEWQVCGESERAAPARFSSRTSAWMRIFVSLAAPGELAAEH